MCEVLTIKDPLSEFNDIVTNIFYFVALRKFRKKTSIIKFKDPDDFILNSNQLLKHVH